MSNDLFTYIIYQAGVSNLPSLPVIQDLAEEACPMTGEETMDSSWRCTGPSSG